MELRGQEARFTNPVFFPPGGTLKVFILNDFFCLIFLELFVCNIRPLNSITAARTYGQQQPPKPQLLCPLQAARRGPSAPSFLVFRHIPAERKRCFRGARAMGAILHLFQGVVVGGFKHLKGSRHGPPHGLLYFLRLCKNLSLKKKRKKKQTPLGLRLLCAQPRSCKGPNFRLKAVIFIFFFCCFVGQAKLLNMIKLYCM